ncbi:MAG TPA: hypothetical protein VG960_02800 [Caulobacteraceae bacterium]|nr:hypothetical protein [Caulobacteraceae bacterium]
MAQARAGIFGPFHDQNGRKLQFPPLGFKQAPVATSSATPGLLGDLADLRRQQAQFRNTLNDLDRRNRWLAIPALAPAAAVVGLEAAEGLLGRAAMQTIQRPPFEIPERDPYRQVGDNWSTRIGRRAHAELRDKVQAKPEWKYDKAAVGTKLRPDVATKGQRYMELKPNTPSGRKAAAAALKKYREGIPNAGRPRALFYDPKKFQ